MKALTLENFGGPSALALSQIPDPEAGAGQLEISVEAAGINYIDTYHREGIYPLDVPAVIGREGTGTIIGGDIESAQAMDARLSLGSTVSWVSPLGSYAQRHVIPVEQAIPVDAELEAPVRATLFLKALTAHFLVHDLVKLKPGDWAVVHAGAGGVGHYLIAMLKARGVRIISTCSEAKLGTCRDRGVDHALTYEQFTGDHVKDLSSGGVDIVFDGVGQATFTTGLETLRPRGLMALYGAASGPVAPMDPQMLNKHGSLFLTRPMLDHYIPNHSELLQRCDQVYAQLASGEISALDVKSFPLEQGAQAHELLQSRTNLSALCLVP